MQRAFVRFGFGALATFGLTLAASTVHAQEFYRAGKISVALERGFGIHYTSQEFDPDNGPSNDFDATAIGLGWYGALSAYHWTRGAVDGFITDQLSIGGSLGFFSHSGDADDDGFLFAPRVGYAIPLSRVFTFWPRGGVTFYDTANRSVFGLSGEAMFVASPSPSWGILFGPTLDLGFIGDAGNDVDYTEFAIGFPAVGLMGTF